MPQSTDVRLLVELTRVFEPLSNAIANESGARGLQIMLHSADVEFDTLDALGDTANQIQSKYQNLLQRLQLLIDSGGFPDTNEIQELYSQIKSLLDEISQLGQEVENLTGEISDVGRRLLDYLLVVYLERYYHRFYDSLVFAGIITFPFGDHAPLTELHLEKFVNLLRTPEDSIGNVYNWGTDNINIPLLFARLKLLLWSLGVPAIMMHFPSPQSDEGEIYTSSVDEVSDKYWQLRMPLLSLVRNDNITSVGLSLLPLPPGEQLPSGVALVPYGAGKVSETISLPDNWQVRIEASADATVDYGIIVRPNLVDIDSLSNGDSPDNLHLLALLERSGSEQERMVLLGNSDGSRFEVGTIGLHLGFDFVRTGNSNQAEFLIALPVQGARLVLPVAEGDGFLNSILPTDGAAADFSFTIGWSSIHGFHFEGNSNLAVTLPEHIEIGPVKISQITLALEPEETGTITFTASGSIRTALGPVVVTVEEMGFQSTIAFPEDRSGNLGLLDFRQEFKPPKGAGILVDACSVVGGGFLLFDRDKGRYAGALQLNFHDKLVLKAVGILTTRLPDGSEGFSLLVIISAEFESVQLGFGFTLNGVGGLVGVNRTLIRQVLQDGLKNQTLDSVLFPESPLDNAQQLISDLGQIFPQAQERFVIGPMAILGWGSPTILTAELGIILIFPSPIELVVLGRMKMVLPTDESALVLIQMDVLGFIDFSRGEAEVDAVLYDSRITLYCLTGDMAMRLKWTGRPNFALSVGGLNPRFMPPTNFPDLDRVAISLTTGNNPRIRLEAYVALTSNTVQLGARLDLYAEHVTWLGNVYSVSGNLSFDSLFEFSPFCFVTDIGAGVSLKRNERNLIAVRIDLMLAGPSPWHARGEATIEVCGFSGSISFDRSIGRREYPELPVPDPLGDLINALEDHRNWNSELPSGCQMLVSLSEPANQDGEKVMIHPMGRLTVRQKVLPLDISIDRYGKTAFTDKSGPITVSLPREYSISLSKINDQSANGILTAPIKDYFAPAQFIQMSDNEKISSPPFELMQAGIHIETEGLDCSSESEEVELTYEELIIDEANDEFCWRPTSRHKLKSSAFNFAANFGACARSRFKSSGKAKFAGKELGIRIKDHQYTVAGIDNLEQDEILGLHEEGVTYTEAKRAMDNYLHDHPEKEGSLQVVGIQEVS